MYSLPLTHYIVVKNNNNKQVLTKGVQMVKSKKKVLKPNLPMKQMKQLKKASSTQGKCKIILIELLCIQCYVYVILLLGKEKTRQNERSSLNALENNTSFDDAYSKEHNVQCKKCAIPIHLIQCVMIL